MTVITPSLNGREYLDDCINSVLGQRGPGVDVEHILVDGGSTDGTPDLAARRGCTVLTREERSITAALNKGLAHASGSLVSMLGCDDVLLPGALDAVVRRFEREGRPWLMGACRWIDATGRPMGQHKAPPAWTPVRALASLGWSPFPAIATFLLRDFLTSLGGFDQRFEYAPDLELFLRARSRNRYSRLARPLAAQRRHGSNMSMQDTAHHRDELDVLRRRHGASSTFLAAADEFSVKLLMNATSPSWYLHKHVRREPPRPLPEPTSR